MKKLFLAAVLCGLVSPAVAQVQRTIRNLPTQCSAVPNHFESIMQRGGYKIQSVGALFPPTGTYEYYSKDNGGAFAIFTRENQGSLSLVCLILEGSKVFFPDEDKDAKPEDTPTPGQH